MSAAFLKVKPGNVSTLFAEKSADDLPNPFNEAQTEGLRRDLQRIAKEGGTPEEQYAGIVHATAIWTARAARHYAWQRICDLRDDLALQQAQYLSALGGLKAMQDELELALMMHEQRLENLEKQR